MAADPQWYSVHRSSFGRYDLMRKRVEPKDATSCDWCGTKPKHRHPLYEYGVSYDGKNGAVEAIKGQYCSTDCYCTYNNVTLDQ